MLHCARTTRRQLHQRWSYTTLDLGHNVRFVVFRALPCCPGTENLQIERAEAAHERRPVIFEEPLAPVEKISGLRGEVSLSLRGRLAVRVRRLLQVPEVRMFQDLYFPFFRTLCLLF